MRLFISGSAPLLAETHHQFAARTGQAILERYGMTETNMITSNPYDGDRRAGTVGLPLAGIDLRIADAETGKVCADGEIGIIELRGDNVFQGYWEMPEKTAESFREDGFFITGDMAVRDADGYISIVGRDKDMIISGGLNVYPREVENLVDDINGVIESAVIGVPHPDFGEAVVAIVAAGDDTVRPSRHHRCDRWQTGKIQTAKGRPHRAVPAAQFNGQGAEGSTAPDLCHAICVMSCPAHVCLRHW
jgi:malonyl-CoA/methylmalonyl-CoA synthetase